MGYAIVRRTPHDLHYLCICLLCLLGHNKQKYGPFFPALLLFSAILITVIYLSWPYPNFHRISYGILVTIVIGKCIQDYQHISDENYRFYIKAGICSYLFGFFLWNIDYHFCDQMRAIRKIVFPFSPFFELHAWWHWFTALGTYLFIFVNSYRRAKTWGLKVKVFKVLGLPILVVENHKKQK